MHFTQYMAMVCLFINLKFYYSHAGAKFGDFMQKKHKLKVVMKTCETQIMINFYSASLTAWHENAPLRKLYVTSLSKRGVDLYVAKTMIEVKENWYSSS